MDIESCISAASRAQQADDAQLGNCARIWHVGFFFDGIHRNIEQDAPEQRLSNIARMFRAFPDEMQNSSTDVYSKIYISGLGTPFQEDLATKLHTVMDGTQGSVWDDLKSQPGEMAKEAGGELLTSNNWYEVIKDQEKNWLTRRSGESWQRMP
ncbi:hypothetical protein ACSFCW_10195 [Yokenella regensburgei]|uniref:hypothetical protein n=1 Tax=Yokenella regensburgei TaxID=158877 RepID=UPI003EDA0FA7